MATSEKMSDEIINIKCCLCDEHNRTTEADKYCVQCKDYYCTPCTDAHSKFRSMKAHTLLDRADFKSLGPDGSLPSFPTQRCSEHQTEVINLFCADHDEVACASCIALKHRTCTKIHSIPEDIYNLYNRKELTTMKQKTNKMKTTLQEIKTAKEHTVKELKTMFDKEVESVKAFRQELQTLLDNMEQETIRQLTTEYERIESGLTREITRINNLTDALNEASSQLKKSEGNTAQEFVSIKSAGKMTAQAEDQEKEHNRKAEETVSFSADQNIKTFLQQFQALGKVSTDKQSMTYKKNGLYKVKHRRQIDTKLVNDTRKCNINGSCLTEDGSLLLADQGNKKLKRLDLSSERVTDYLDLPSHPHAVCMVSNTEAAVSLSNKTVQIVSLGSKLTTANTLTMNHPCWGLGYHDGKLFISGEKAVYIHNINGKQLQTISTDASGNNIFQESRHITFSGAGDRVFVADFYIGLVIFDHQGNYVSTLTDLTVTHTLGLCTDGRNLFVSDYYTHNIMQIGQDYKLLGQLEKVNNPRSLCFDPSKTRLIVTSANNTITVLELE